ncbi:MAG: tetratricopeptide repeat protein [Gammaproteobacteria bacterium]|nr:tetratricopeptide repeat protein [Gammaproteobacteria bacterium]
MPHFCRLLPALLAVALGGCVTLQSTPSGEAVHLDELRDRHVYVGDSMPLNSDAAQLLQAYREVLLHHHDPALQREATKRVADLEVEGTMAAAGDDYSGSIARYLEVLDAAPDHPDNEQVLYNLARAFAQQGEAGRQFKVMGDILTHFPESAYRPELLFRRGEHLFSRGDNREAVAHYEAVLQEGALNPFYEQALYKKAWGELRQMELQLAFDDFFHLVKRKLTPAMLSRGEPLEQLPLMRGEREMVADVLRGTTLAVALGSEDMLSRMFVDETLKPYAYLLYAVLVERYISQERYNDAAEAALGFVTRIPRHPYAPVLQLKVLESYRLGGFVRQLQQAREEFVERYRLQGEHWRFLPVKAQEFLQPHLKEINHALAANAHALAQRSGKAEDYDTAIHWYRRYLDSFPAESESAQLNFMLAEALFANQRYDEAVSTYERSAYHYPRAEGSATAGYAALVAYERHEQTLPAGEFRERWHWLAVSSSLNFVNTFRDDSRTPRVLANAAQELYGMHLYRRAADTVHRLLNRRPLPEHAVLLAAWTVLGYSEFELGHYAEAETAYRQVLAMSRPADALYHQRLEWLAAAIYKQAEQARAQGYLESAANHFKRVGELASGSKIQVTSDYDAAAALLAAGRWEAAIGQLQLFRRTYPKSPLMTDVSDKLAVAYMQAGRTLEAAREFEALYMRKGEEREKREILWLAAELYEKLDDTPSRIRTYRAYVNNFPAPLEPAMEMRWKLVTLHEAQGNTFQRDRWANFLVKAYAGSGVVGTPRSRFLAASAQLVLARPLFEAFDRVTLVEPLQKSLRQKKSVMEQALARYASIIDYQVAEATTNASYHIAELHRRFAKALLESERPANLNEEELEQYQLLLEEQAYPFEESALQVHEANVARISEGLFDEWTKQSLAVLAQLHPVRYAKSELSEELFDGRD